MSNSKGRISPQPVTRPTRPRRGFILPMTVLLVLVLSISGMGFMQLDFLERRVTLNETDNHRAFYLASAGLERTRAALKIAVPENGSPNWSLVLADEAFQDTSGDPLLCPLGPPCIAPPFGLAAIDAVSGEPPFDAAFGRGAYTVRAFNNSDVPGETSTQDVDNILILHSLGIAGNEQKLLEVQVFGISGLKLINCGYSDNSPPAECPDMWKVMQGLARTNAIEGREPEAFLSNQLPTFNQAFYENYKNFPWIQGWQNGLPSDFGKALSDDWDPFAGPPSEVINRTLPSNTYFFVNGDVTLPQEAYGEGVVIFSTGTVELKQKAELINSIVIGLEGVKLRNEARVTAPLSSGHFPAIVAGGPIPNSTSGGKPPTAVDLQLLAVGDPDKKPPNVLGAIYAVSGNIELGMKQKVEGVIIARDGEVIMNAESRVTDEGKLEHYNFLRGFTYPPDSRTTEIVPGTWRELQ